MNRTDGSAQTRLAEAMDARRSELRLRWEEVALRAEISGTHLRRIRRGESGFTDIVEARLEEALAWAPGSISAVLGGADPTPTRRDGAPSGPSLSEKPDIGELQAQIDALMADLPLWRRQRLQRLMAEEEDELERVREARLRRWKEVIQDQRLNSDLS